MAAYLAEALLQLEEQEEETARLAAEAPPGSESARLPHFALVRPESRIPRSATRAVRNAEALEGDVVRIRTGEAVLDWSACPENGVI